MASFPNSIRTFTTKENVIHVVDADHPNVMQDEITAIETYLGTNPHISTARSLTYASVKARLEDIETDYRRLDQPEPHGGLTGLSGDDHTQYLRTDGTRAPTGLTAMTAAPVAAAVGDAQATGTANTLARSDHRHAVTAGLPAASAVGDTQAEGVATTHARSDHRHAREAFGAVAAATTFGIAAANGSATTVARSDHTHGTPALSSTTPAAEDYSTAGAVGVGTTAARADHVHAMPALSSTAPVVQAFGDAAAVGIATTPARADHRHGMPALASTVVAETTWGIAPAVGVSTSAARADHTHGSPDATLQGPTGVVAMWPTNTPPAGWLLCNGQAVSRTTYATLYAALGGASSPWGQGDGSTTFNVPDIRGRVIVGAMGAGAGLTSRALAATGGAETVALSLAELAAHSHTVNSHSHGGGTGHTDPAHSHTISYEYVTTSFMAANWDHSHHYDQPGVGNIGLTPGSNQYALNRLGNQTGVANINHQHSADHGHTCGTTGINHNHSIPAESPGTNSQGSGAAHNNMQPWVAMPYIIKT